jgi:bis(5'-nucleosidyl)-tetraphosphatase
MSELKAAGAICYLKDGKKVYFVLLRSAKHGEWGPPKGHAEPGETELETATRELFEEAGVRRGSFLPGFREAITYTVNKKGKTHSKEVVFFLCELESEEIKLSHEHSEFHMATLDEIEVLLQHEDLREIFRKAAKHIASKK